MDPQQKEMNANDRSLDAWLERLSSPLPGTIYLLIAVPLSFVLGFLLHAYAVPVLNALVLYPILVPNARKKRAWRNAYLIAVWGFLLNISVILATRLDAEFSTLRIINGGAYAGEMFQWIDTGRGAEGDIRLFLPQHAKCYVVLLALTALTGGLAGFVFAAILINFMAYYVGHLVLAAYHPVQIFTIGWPIWSIVRGFGFLAVMVGLMEAFYDRISGAAIQWKRLAFFMLLSFALMTADVLIKTTCAEFWRHMLSAALHGRQ